MNAYELSLLLIVLVPTLITGIYYYYDWVNRRTIRKFKRRRGEEAFDQANPKVALGHTGFEYWERKTGKAKDE